MTFPKFIIILCILGGAHWILGATNVIADHDRDLWFSETEKAIERVDEGTILAEECFEEIMEACAEYITFMRNVEYNVPAEVEAVKEGSMNKEQKKLFKEFSEKVDKMISVDSQIDMDQVLYDLNY